MLSKTININGRDNFIPTGLFINDEFVAAKGGREFDIENPATGEKSSLSRKDKLKMSMSPSKQHEKPLEMRHGGT